MGIVGVLLLGALLGTWTLKSLRAAPRGYWLPPALGVLIVIHGLFESALSFGGVGGDLWLLSILLFLEPVDDEVDRTHGKRADHKPRVLSVSPEWGPEHV
jgi:hypothetical protein